MICYCLLRKKELFYSYNVVFIFPVFWWTNMCERFFFSVTNLFWLTVCMCHKLIIVFLTSGVCYKLRFSLKMWPSYSVSLGLLLTVSVTACWSVYFSCSLVILWSCIFFPFSVILLPSFLTCPVSPSSGCGLWLGRRNFSAGELWKAELSEILIGFILLNPGCNFKASHFLYWGLDNQFNI